MTHNRNYHHFDETKAWSVLKFNNELASAVENQVHKLVDYAEDPSCTFDCSPSKETIDILAEVGIKTTIKHERMRTFFFRQDRIGDKNVDIDQGNDLHQKGGRTVVTLTDQTGCSVTGVAHCNKTDSYNKKLGVAIALRRALRTVL